MKIDFKRRNLYRNLIAQSVSAMFPGAQRNNTSRDSFAFQERLDYSGCQVITDVGGSPMAGVSTVGE